MQQTTVQRLVNQHSLPGVPHLSQKLALWLLLREPITKKTLASQLLPIETKRDLPAFNYTICTWFPSNHQTSISTLQEYVIRIYLYFYKNSINLLKHLFSLSYGSSLKLTTNVNLPMEKNLFHPWNITTNRSLILLWNFSHHIGGNFNKWWQRIDNGFFYRINSNWVICRLSQARWNINFIFFSQNKKTNMERK